MTWISIKESLISKIKKPASIVDIKNDIDVITIPKYFSIFSDDVDAMNGGENWLADKTMNALKNGFSKPGAVIVKGNEYTINLDIVGSEMDYKNVIYVDYIGLWKDLGLRKLIFTGSIEHDYVLSNKVSLYGISKRYNHSILNLPSGIELNIEHKEYNDNNVGFNNFYGIEKDVKYNLKNFFFYNTNFDRTKIEFLLTYLSAEVYYKNGNYNSWGFPIRILDFVTRGGFNRMFKATGSDLSKTKRYSNILKNSYGYNIMYKRLKECPYFPVTNLNRFAYSKKNTWEKETELIFYVPSADENIAKNYADKHLKDDSNPYTKFEFITYKGEEPGNFPVHKTKKELEVLKSGGFVVLSI